jgi:uncharacterized protein (UPF0264 family)
MTSSRRHVRFLASVTSEGEAALAAECGADIVDCKNPEAGALGALPVATVRAIRTSVPAAIPVSATIGDLACERAPVTGAAAAMAAAGVEFIKVGLFPGVGTLDTIAALGEANLQGSRLVGVLLTDLELDWALVEAMGRARFAGAMLDTAGKKGGELTSYMSMSQLSEFLRRSRDAGMFAGLAGSLRARHIPQLAALGPDILGFRGALCAEGRREGPIDPTAVHAIRQEITAANELRTATISAFARELT